MKEVILDSRHTNLKQAEVWKKVTLEHAVRIYNTDEDIKNFIKKEYEN